MGEEGDSTRDVESRTETRDAFEAPGSRVEQTEKEQSVEKSSVEQEVARGEWDNQLQFILSCVGLAVGLSNIWRFPSLAYQNGGGAFLIPYITCAMLVGLPMTYLEFLLGQYTSSGPGVVFKKYVPAFHGIGWCMALVVFLIGSYYNVVISWIAIYIVKILMGDTMQITSCENWWNSEYCASKLMDDMCHGRNATYSYFVNKTCHPESMRDMIVFPGNLSTITPAEEFLQTYINARSEGFHEMGGVNWRLLGANGAMWILVAVLLSRGVEWIGKTAYLTATVPYVIIAVLFVRGVTLEGAMKGIDFYLLNPDLSKIWNIKAWKEALIQVCYTLSSGQGAMLAMASFNKFNHNCFRDTLIVVFADSFMSIFGGVAVFSTMGFLAHHMNMEIEDVVQQGANVAFVAYMEAAARMSLPWLWSFLFMIMLFLLGISSQIGMANVLITSICDQWPATRNRKGIVSIAVCASAFTLGICMCIGSGNYFFILIDAYSAAIGPILMCILEVVVIMYIYGWKNFLIDVESMMGKSTTWFGRIFGKNGYILRICWLVVTPIAAAIVFYNTLIPDKLTVGKGARLYVFPDWCEYVGWVIAVTPVLPLPLCLFYTIFEHKDNWRALFRCQPDHPSYARINGLDEEKKEEETA